MLKDIRVLQCSLMHIQQLTKLDAPLRVRCATEGGIMMQPELTDALFDLSDLEIHDCCQIALKRMSGNPKSGLMTFSNWVILKFKMATRNSKASVTYLGSNIYQVWRLLTEWFWRKCPEMTNDLFDHSDLEIKMATSRINGFLSLTQEETFTRFKSDGPNSFGENVLKHQVWKWTMTLFYLNYLEI